jgi:hypothetical protein
MILPGSRHSDFGISKQQQSQRLPAGPPYFRGPPAVLFQEEWNEDDIELSQQTKFSL